MVMTEELDAGPIVARWPVALAGRETTPELEARLADLAADVVPPVLERWAGGEIETEPQDDSAATHVHPFTRADGWIDWRRPAVEIDRQVRALQPWPGAWTTIDDRRLHVRRARPVAGVDDVPIGALMPGEQPWVACGAGALELEIVQPEGRRRCPPRRGGAASPASTSSSAPDAPRRPAASAAARTSSSLGRLARKVKQVVRRPRRPRSSRPRGRAGCASARRAPRRAGR